MVGRAGFTSCVKWLIPALILLTGCEEKSPLNLGAFIPPTVIRTDPANGATGVPTNTPIVLTFDMHVDCASLNNSTCRLPHNTFTKDECDDGVVVLIPDTLLAPNTRHTITLSRGVRSHPGQEMERDFSFSFTTGPAARPVINRLSADAARVEERLTIYGKYFMPSISGNTVCIGSDTVSILNAFTDSIVLKVPREYTNGRVSVTTIGGTGTSSGSFEPLWAQIEINRSGAMRATAWSGSRYAAVGDKGMVAYSDNGFDWYAGTTPGGPSPWGLPLVDVIWDGSRFVAAAEGGEILTSDDGESYVQVAHLGIMVGGLAWNGNTYVAAGGYPPGIRTSSDLITWDDHAAPNHLANVEWTGSRFIAVGDSNTILLSDDGAAWNALPVSGVPVMSCTAATEFAGQFVIGGFRGVRRIITAPVSSPVNWTTIWATEWDPFLGDFAEVDERLVFVGTYNFIYFTSFPIAWHHNHSVGSSETILNFIHEGNRFVAVCNGGSILTSPTGFELHYE